MIRLKEYSIPFFFLLMTAPLLGQTVDFNRVIVPPEYKAKTFKEYLVQLAWQNSPENRVFKYEIDIAKEEEKIQRWEWTKGLSALFNYNEAHFINDFFPPPVEEGEDPLVQSLVFPRFNLSAQIDLGTILSHDNEKQIKKLKTKIAESNLNQQKLIIRAKVLEQYEVYLQADDVLQLRVQAETDASQAYQLATALFKAGEAKLEDFTSSAVSFFTAKEATLDARTEVELARIKLEELIGVSLEEARKFGPKEGQKEG